MQKVRECLLIDDDPDDQEIFVMCVNDLKKAIHCRTMNNCVDAVEHLTSASDYTPDYVFIDVNMPKMNGIECLRVLKTIDRLKDCRIFMYSTTSEMPVLAECMQLGAEDFIVKPASMAVLRERLSAIFGVTSAAVK